MDGDTRAARRIRLHEQLVRRRRNSNALDELLVRMYGEEAAAEYGIHLEREPVPYAAGGMDLGWRPREYAGRSL